MSSDEPYPIRVRAKDCVGGEWMLELVQPTGDCRLFFRGVLVGSALWYVGMLHRHTAKKDRHYDVPVPWKPLEDALRLKIDRLRVQAEAVE